MKSNQNSHPTSKEVYTNQAFDYHEPFPVVEKKSEELNEKINFNLKWKILKNVLLISIAFMVLFTSFQSMSSLQSSINKA